MFERWLSRSRPRLFLLGVVLVAGHVSVSTQTPEQGPLTLTVMAPGPLKPGGVALISVASTHELTELSGDAAGRRVHFWRNGSARQWNGLVGINLESAPGTVTLTIHGRTVAGMTAATRVSLPVARYRFETRRLQVDPKLANPPEEELARIKEEAKAMAEAFMIVTPERYWHGRFDAPVPGTATSSFGRLTITNGKPAGRHQGADFRAATGTPVRAPNAGRVVIARNLYFAGNTVIIDHGLGVFSLLAHLSRIDVAPGATVSRGDQVGESGATGRVTGPHLHWAVRFGEMTVDPLALMSALAKQSDEDVSHPSH
jgi:murein DD-endopeptidase MepM/ murein hydrolase activator NlpD